MFDEEKQNEKLIDYTPMPGVADELMDEDGNVRPVWNSFLTYFAKLSEDEIQKRFQRGNQYLRDAGVFYRQYTDDGSTERDWPFSHIPVMLSEAEWDHISTALTQRADLLEDIIADLYGPNHLVRSGQLPPELIAQLPQWQRPMVGVKPRSGHFLNLIAFEIGRGPDGTWWVLGDRTQAPSGAGFSLENRVAASRTFSEYYADSNVRRLSVFFKAFRETLGAMSNPEDCGIGILTPGRLNDTYFEHAYIARYLGFMLLEGEDITIRNGKAMVRTVDGLKPISVLWRRMDSDYIDPLELNEFSQIGTPGLAEAVRQGNVSMINALGVGVLEARALMAFVPRICQALRNEQLMMPNIATWWCGQESEQEHVLAHAERMMIGPALSTSLPFELNEMVSLADPDRFEELVKAIHTRGTGLVGQEAITLSTAPVYQDGKLVPRPMSLRVFMARTENGWKAMPGGYARIGNDEGPTVIAMQGGGKVADVWVMSARTVNAPVTDADANDRHFSRPLLEVLPSRAADNLFWLGRYIERAEMFMRLARAWHTRLGEHENPDQPLLTHFKEMLDTWELDIEEGVPEAICETLSSAIGSASHIRDRFSVDGWTALGDLANTASNLNETSVSGDDSAHALQILLQGISGFSGLVHESMYHYTGWRLLSIGRALERAAGTSFMLAHLCEPDAPEGSLDLAVEIGDSLMAHRRRFIVATNRNTVVDLMGRDLLNPRSILFQVNAIQDHLKHMPGEAAHKEMTSVSRAALRLHTDLAIQEPCDLDPDELSRIGDAVYELSNLISASYLQ